MIRKYVAEYNPKIDFKIIHFQNPKYDIEKDYFELKDIFRKRKNYYSEQGKWFQKTMNVYNHLFEEDVFNLKTFAQISIFFEIDLAV